MAKGKKIDDATRAQIMSALLTGQGVSQVATDFGVSKSTVSRLRKKLSEADLKQLETKKEENIADLLLDYVCTNLKTLKAQSEEAGKPEWIKHQNASELAVFHGVLADKTARILGALEDAGS